MDLRQHIGVWRRWRVPLTLGIVVAIVLGILASFKPSLSGGSPLRWRGEPTYTSKSRVFVTQSGFPWGRVTLPGSLPGTAAATPAAHKGAVQFADPARFSNLAIVYSYLAESDAVRALIRPVPAADRISVTYQATGGGDALPLLEIDTKGTTERGARTLNENTIAALTTYLRAQLTANKVARPDRVELQVLNPPERAKLTAGRTPTLSVVAFVLVLIGTLLLVYILENLYPAKRSQPDDAAVRPLRLDGLPGDELDQAQIGDNPRRTKTAVPSV